MSRGPGAERRFWGWGVEGAGPTRAQQEKMGQTIAARFGAPPREPIEPPDDRRDRPPRAARRAARTRSRTSCTTDPEERAGHTYGKSFRDIWRGAAPRLLAAARPRGHPARRARRRGAARLVQRRGRRRDPVRRRLLGGRRRRVRHRRRRTAARSASTCARSTRCSRSTATSRAARVQAGVYGPALEDQLRPHGLTLAALPAVVRVLDARRLARDPLRRPLRDAAHAHRRLRRVDPRGDAARRVGEPAPARLRRRAVARPHAARLRGHARRDHRGVDAPPGPADVPRVGHGALLDVQRRHRRGSGDRAVGPAPGQLPAPRPARSAAHRHRRPRRHAAAPRVRVGRPSARRVDRARGRVRRSTTARASTTTRSSIRSDGSGQARARARPGAGATRSCARRTPATRSSALGMISETFETACTWDRFDDALRRGHDRRARHRRGSRARGRR